MNTYSVDVHEYPSTYNVTARSEAEAREKAIQMHNELDGGSVYETVVNESK